MGCISSKKCKQDLIRDHVPSFVKKANMQNQNTTTPMKNGYYYYQKSDITHGEIKQVRSMSI